MMPRTTSVSIRTIALPTRPTVKRRDMRANGEKPSARSSKGPVPGAHVPSAFLPPPMGTMAVQSALALSFMATSTALSSHPEWKPLIAGSHLAAPAAALLYVDLVRRQGAFGSFGLFAPEFYWLSQTAGVACSGALLSAFWCILDHLR